MRAGQGRADTTTSAAGAPARIQILHVPDCPLLGRLLSDLVASMTAAAVSEPVEVVVGQYPSPSLVIDGLDVATGEPITGEPRCRLDLPAVSQIRAALVRLGRT